MFYVILQSFPYICLFIFLILSSEVAHCLNVSIFLYANCTGRNSFFELMSINLLDSILRMWCKQPFIYDGLITFWRAESASYATRILGTFLTVAGGAAGGGLSSIYTVDPASCFVIRLLVQQWLNAFSSGPKACCICFSFSDTACLRRRSSNVWRISTRTPWSRLLGRAPGPGLRTRRKENIHRERSGRANSTLSCP